MKLSDYIIKLIVPVMILTLFSGQSCRTNTGTNIEPGPIDLGHEAEPDSFSGLFGYWTFVEGSGTKLGDSSSYSLDGEIKGAQWLKDEGHPALSFDGKNDYVRMNSMGGNMLSHLSQLGEGTLSIWFKLNSLPSGEHIYPIFYYGKANACDFFDAANEGLIVEVGHHPVQRQSKRLYFTIWANGCTYPSFCFDSNHAVKAGVWYHFAAVVGPDYNTGYLNGEEMITRRYNFGTRGYSQFFKNARKHEELWLGRGYWDTQMNYFDGLIGEVRIYADPLEGMTIKALYDRGK